jgi:hypothetical protein
MSHRARGAVLALLLAGGFGGAPLAWGQAPGMPTQFSPAALPGLRIGLDYSPSRGVDGRMLLSHAFVGLGASVGGRNDGGATWSGSGAVYLVRSPAWPWVLSLEGGYGEGWTRWDGESLEAREAMVGLAMGPNLEGPASVLVPWLAARLHRRWATAPGEPAETGTTGVGLSAGTELRLSPVWTGLGRIGGPSLHLAGDLLSVAGLNGGRAIEWRLSMGVNLTRAFTKVAPRGLLSGR